jgi:hypothetical protein
MFHDSIQFMTRSDHPVSQSFARCSLFRAVSISLASARSRRWRVVSSILHFLNLRTVLMVRLGFQPPALWSQSSYLLLASTSCPRLRLGEVSPCRRRLGSSSCSFVPLCSLFLSLTQKERRKKKHVPGPLVVSAFGGFELGPKSLFYYLFLQ